MGKIERKNFFWRGCGQERVIGKWVERKRVREREMGHLVIGNGQEWGESV